MLRAHARFESSTEGHWSVTLGSATRCTPCLRQTGERLANRHWRAGLGPPPLPLSLSPSPINMATPIEASPFIIFLPNAEVRTLRCSLSASHQLAPPLGDSSRLANPRFPCASFALGSDIISQLLCWPSRITWVTSTTTSELLPPCFSSPARLCLMSAVLVSSKEARLEAP
jgi:hypothetical protein